MTDDSNDSSGAGGFGAIQQKILRDLFRVHNLIRTFLKRFKPGERVPETEKKSVDLFQQFGEEKIKDSSGPKIDKPESE